MGAALQFKESGQLIKVPHTDVLNIAGGLTISVWLRPIRLRENDLSILAKRSGDDNRYDFQLSLSGFTRLRYAWSHRTNQVVALSNDVLPVNRWFQIAVVHKSGKSLAFYVNGEEVEYKLTTPDRFLPTTELTRGVHGRRLRIGHNYSGAMDDLRIYNRALTAEEIKSLFDMEKPKTK